MFTSSLLRFPFSMMLDKKLKATVAEKRGYYKGLVGRIIFYFIERNPSPSSMCKFPCVEIGARKFFSKLPVFPGVDQNEVRV
jgi:hypothetical protein